MKYRVDKSKIHGDGVFATQPIKKGEYISDIPDYIDNVNQTIASSFHNHDEKNANVLNTEKGNKRFLIAKRGIEVGEELTADYNLTPSPPFEDPNNFKDLDERELPLSAEEAQAMIDGGFELEELDEETYEKGGSKRKKGYRRIYEEGTGSTEFGRRKEVDVYRPLTRVGKTLVKDITYKTDDSPRVKYTEREVTRRNKDGSVKSYKKIVRKNGKIVDEATTKKIKYDHGGSHDSLPTEYLKSQGFADATNQDLDSLLRGFNTDGYDSHWYQGKVEDYGVTADQLRGFATENRPKGFVNAAAYAQAMNKLSNEAGGTNVSNIPFAQNAMVMRTDADDLPVKEEYVAPQTLQEQGYINETGTNAVNQDKSYSTGLAKRYGTNMYDHLVEEKDGGPVVKQRKGVRENPDGTVSSHLMRAEYIPERGWVAFPSLFQDDDGTWVDMSEEENWEKILAEANKRGEVYEFGDDKFGALAFGMGSWKPENQNYNLKRALELGYEPDETGHWPSVDDQTGMFLKSMDHPTSWKEYMYGQLNKDIGTNTKVVVNPEGHFGDKQLQYIDAELTPEEADKYKAGGYVLEEIPTYNEGGLVRFEGGGGIDSKLKVKTTFGKERIDELRLRHKQFEDENTDVQKISFEQWLNYQLMDQRTTNNPEAKRKFTDYMVVNEDGTASVYDGEEIKNRIYQHGRKNQQLIDAGLPEGDHSFLQEHIKRATANGEIRYMNHIKKGLSQGMTMAEIKKDMLNQDLISEAGWNEKYEGKTADHINTQYDKVQNYIKEFNDKFNVTQGKIGSKIDPALMDIKQLQMDSRSAYDYVKPEPVPEVKYQRVAGTGHMEPIIDLSTIKLPTIPDPNAVSPGEALFNKNFNPAGLPSTSFSWSNLTEKEKQDWSMKAVFETANNKSAAYNKTTKEYVGNTVNQMYNQNIQSDFDNNQLDPRGRYIGEGTTPFINYDGDGDEIDALDFVPWTEQEIADNELNNKSQLINSYYNRDFDEEFGSKVKQRFSPENYVKVGKDEFGRQKLFKADYNSNSTVGAQRRAQDAYGYSDYSPTMQHSGRTGWVDPVKWIMGPQAGFAGITKNLVGTGLKGISNILRKNPINWASRNLIGKELPGWLNYATTPSNLIAADFAYNSFKPDGFVPNLAEGIQDVYQGNNGGIEKIVDNSWGLFNLIPAYKGFRGAQNLIKNIKGTNSLMPVASNSRFGNYGFGYASPSGNTNILRANPDYVIGDKIKNFKPSFDINMPGIGRFQGAKYTEPTAAGYSRATKDPFGFSKNFSLNTSGTPSTPTSGSGFSLGNLTSSFSPAAGAQSMNMGFGTDFNLGYQNFKNTLFPKYTAPTSADVKFRPSEITRYNPKTGLNEIYRANLPDRIVPGRSYENVKHKMSNLYRDLGYNSILGPKATFNLERLLSGSNNEISLVRDSGITYNPQSGSLFDSNSRYWANRRLGITPSPDQFHSTMQNQIIDDQSEFVGFAGSDASPGVKYLNEPLVSSYDKNLSLGLTSEGTLPFSGFSVNEPFMKKDALGNINISKGKGRTMSYDDANEFYTGLGQKYPSLNIEDPSVYFHGTTSGTLPGFMQQKGLMNQGDLLKQGVVPAAGENFIGAQGMNQSMLSTAFGTDIPSATRYSLMGNKNNSQSDFENWWTEGRQKYLAERGESRLMPEVEYYDKLYSDRMTQFENASDVEKTFLSENYPMMFGINPRSGDASRFVIPRSDISGEVGIKGKLDFQDIPQIFVPRSKMQLTKDYLGNDFQVAPIDPFFQNMDWRNKWQQDHWKDLDYKKGGFVDVELTEDEALAYARNGYIVEAIN